ncbi:Bacillus/Clostridium GerA spore germination protein [Actinobacillus pleuropneumoniae]|nr:Bacillus/Clostridium GerA spore germination protein [Actinobacillus pleuropneumoniae]
MPRVIGPAISIVGALVLGQAAVQAGLVSGAMVIVVSFTAIANFAIPAFSMAAAIRLIRFALMLLAGNAWIVRYFGRYRAYLCSLNLLDLVRRTLSIAFDTAPLLRNEGSVCPFAMAIA